MISASDLCLIYRNAGVMISASDLLAIYGTLK